MAATTAWIAGRGQGLTWGSAGFTATDFNSKATNTTVVATTTITNGTALDLYADVSFSIVNGATTTTTTSYLGLYILPLNQDGTTYGDGTATGNAPPSAVYQVSSAGFGQAIGSGGTLIGAFRGIVMPPGSFRFAVANQTGGSFNAAAVAVVSYRTYNENLNA